MSTPAMLSTQHMERVIMAVVWLVASCSQQWCQQWWQPENCGAWQALKSLGCHHWIAPGRWKTAKSISTPHVATPLWYASLQARTLTKATSKKSLKAHYRSQWSGALQTPRTHNSLSQSLWPVLLHEGFPHDSPSLCDCQHCCNKI